MDAIMTNPKLEVLTPDNCQIIFIDQQPQMAFGVQSMDRQVLKNNTLAAFARPTVLFFSAWRSIPTRNCWTCSRARTSWNAPR